VQAIRPEASLQGPRRKKRSGADGIVTHRTTSPDKRLAARHWLARLLFCGCLATGALFGAPLAQAQTVVVIVNGDPITSYDIDQRSRFAQLVTHKPADRAQVLEELINEKLKLQTGKRYKVEISDQDVDGSFAEMGKRMRLTGAQLAQALMQGGVDPATLKSRIKADLTWQQIVRGKFSSSFQIREKDVLAAAESRKKDDKEVTSFEYVLRPILFVVPRGSPESVVDMRRRDAEALRNRFQNCDEGLPFARALKDVAVRDQIVRNSGDLAPALREILDNTPVGRLTSPETTPHGVELFAVCVKRETKVDAPALREVRQEMFAEQFNAQSTRYLRELRRGAMIEKK
jgi:peptidyl-prolyl cis-trans isomerase SurA